MGLDMYLERINRSAVGYRNIDINELDKDGVLYKKLQPYIKERGQYVHWLSLYEEVAYWRKANAIHAWMVDNVQNGVDDCGYYEVSKEQLEELRDICKELLSKIVMVKGDIVNGQTYSPETQEWENIMEEGLKVINSEVCDELLPSQSGFFFGSTDYDEYYVDDIRETYKKLDKILEETDFDEYAIYYMSSW